MNPLKSLLKLTSAFAVGAAALTALAVPSVQPDDAELSAKWKGVSLYTLKSKSLNGDTADLKQFDGKVTLVVNVASKCGYTSQYEGLQTLYSELKDKGFTIVGFPSNDFGSQEPGTAEEIATFCTKNYGVTFPMMEKVQTKAGDGQSEIYQYLGTRTQQLPAWNFGKYLIGRDGQPVAYYGSKVTPDSKELRDAISKALDVKPALKPELKPDSKPAQPKDPKKSDAST